MCIISAVGNTKISKGFAMSGDWMAETQAGDSGN